MTVVLHFHSVAQVAPVKALTMREWEALARVFGELESGPVRLPSPDLFPWPRSGIADVHRALDLLAEDIDLCIRDRFTRAGLAPNEWIIRAAPRLTHELSCHLYEKWADDDNWPQTEWDVTIRLFGPRSLAKGLVGSDSDTAEAPTLSEQHGKTT